GCFTFDERTLSKVKSERRSTTILDKDGVILREFRGKSDSWTFWVPLNRISPWLRKAIIAVEDKRFKSHPGVDFRAVARAAAFNILRMRRVSGASTLTMQTMRMISPARRTYSAKIAESLKALSAERKASKTEILEWYLNLAPFGGDIYGAEAAARFYFGKSAAELNLPEAALLAGIPQRPTAYRPDRHPAKAAERRKRVLEAMLECGFIAESEKSAAEIEKVRAPRRPVAFLAPHFALLAERLWNSRGAGVPPSADIRTTLDQNIQSVCETALAEHVANLAGVVGGAVVVVENKTGAVRALVGSPDFFDVDHQGQVNCAIAKRSPGSTLKPFLYAMTFDSGTTIPSTRIPDAPCSFNGYSPMNYDKRYHGNVSAREALVQSYNIPAVKLLRNIGVREFIGKMRECGVGGFQNKSELYGLSIILGGARARLVDLTTAYTVFPNHGVLRNRKFFADDRDEERRVFSAATADMIIDILLDTERSAGTPLAALLSGEPRIAWKTGTSNGFHDAWTIGYDSEFTVGVWLGNPNGAASKKLIGLAAAAPLCVRIIRRISSKNSAPLLASASFAETDVCAESGMVACRKCETIERGLINPKIRYRKCDIHGIRKPRKSRLTILSPAAGDYLRGASEAPMKLKLRSSGGSGTAYWFADGEFLGSENGEELFWAVKPGAHTLTCVDESGEERGVSLTISTEK
ncbi:MAG: penicillin-binding protein 1C, partial [Kiritimatiellaeota bacterium]|nr:penicillin-binding protein 1C [Kiritimatiellota bacterium]